MCLFVCLYPPVSVFPSAHMVSVYEFVFVCVYMCTRVCECVRVHVYVYVYVCIHASAPDVLWLCLYYLPRFPICFRKIGTLPLVARFPLCTCELFFRKFYKRSYSSRNLFRYFSTSRNIKNIIFFQILPIVCAPIEIFFSAFHRSYRSLS